MLEPVLLFKGYSLGRRFDGLLHEWRSCSVGTLRMSSSKLQKRNLSPCIEPNAVVKGQQGPTAPKDRAWLVSLCCMEASFPSSPLPLFLFTTPAFTQGGDVLPAF